MTVLEFVGRNVMISERRSGRTKCGSAAGAAGKDEGARAVPSW
jgi:hypothetical protein